MGDACSSADRASHEAEANHRVEDLVEELAHMDGLLGERDATIAALRAELKEAREANEFLAGKLAGAQLRGRQAREAQRARARLADADGGAGRRACARADDEKELRAALLARVAELEATFGRLCVNPRPPSPSRWADPLGRPGGGGKIAAALARSASTPLFPPAAASPPRRVDASPSKLPPLRAPPDAAAAPAPAPSLFQVSAAPPAAYDAAPMGWTPRPGGATAGALGLAALGSPSLSLGL